MKKKSKLEVVVITGASAEVGRATVREFARHGAWIGLIARGKDGLEAARREVESMGGKALVLPTDVADAEQMVQMPALNTPQSGWVKSRLPHKARPVPPIYQTEVAARAIYYAAHHPAKREYFAAWSVVEAVVGNKIAPSFADHYLARTGYDSQQHDGCEDPKRLNNLWEAVPGDHSAHGSFDHSARHRSFGLLAETNWKWLAATTLVTLIALYGTIKANSQTKFPQLSKAA